jgi:periplasmic divalent cation tolerance protein
METPRMTDCFILYSTFPDEPTAERIAAELVENRLVACVNIGSAIKSVFRWGKKIQQTSEIPFIAKTQHGKLTQAVEELKRLHPYEVPCIVAYPITEGFPPFLAWIRDETA